MKFNFNHDIKDLVTRVFWTALESFLAVLVGAGVMNLSISTLEAAGISAVSAALTAVLVWVRKMRAKVDKETENMV